MEKVFISINFGKFKRSKLSGLSEAILFIRENKLINTRIKIKSISSIQEWDNF